MREREGKLSGKNRRKAGRSVGNSRGGPYGYTAETYLINQPTDQPFIDRCNPSHVAPIQTSRALPSARTSARQLSLSRFSPLSYNANYFSPERSISASSSGRRDTLTNLREIIKSFQPVADRRYSGCKRISSPRSPAETGLLRKLHKSPIGVIALAR